MMRNLKIMVEFPEWMIPEEDDGVDIGDFKAVAEWIYMNQTTQDDLVMIHDVIDSYRYEYMDYVDLDDHATMDVMWAGWEFATNSLSWFIEADCEDPDEMNHMIEHFARAMRMSAIVLLGMSNDLPSTLHVVDGEDLGDDLND